MEELCKDIEGFEGYYKISNFGNVKSYDRAVIKTNNSVIGYLGKLLIPYNDGRSYLKVDLRKNNKRISVRVHRLVAKAFIPNPNNYPIINHKDENPSNNCSDNLEWCTQKYNCNYGTGKIRCAESHKKPIISIDKNNNKSYYKSAKDAAIILNVKSSSHITQAAKNQKTAYGLKWEYA